MPYGILKKQKSFLVSSFCDNMKIIFLLFLLLLFIFCSDAQESNTNNIIILNNISMYHEDHPIIFGDPFIMHTATNIIQEGIKSIKNNVFLEETLSRKTLEDFLNDTNCSLNYTMQENITKIDIIYL